MTEPPTSSREIRLGTSVVLEHPATVARAHLHRHQVVRADALSARYAGASAPVRVRGTRTLTPLDAGAWRVVPVGTGRPPARARPATSACWRGGAEVDDAVPLAHPDRTEHLHLHPRRTGRVTSRPVSLLVADQGPQQPAEGVEPGGAVVAGRARRDVLVERALLLVVRAPAGAQRLAGLEVGEGVQETGRLRRARARTTARRGCRSPTPACGRRRRAWGRPRPTRRCGGRGR